MRRQSMKRVLVVLKSAKKYLRSMELPNVHGRQHSTIESCTQLGNCSDLDVAILKRK